MSFFTLLLTFVQTHVFRNFVFRMKVFEECCWITFLRLSVSIQHDSNNFALLFSEKNETSYQIQNPLAEKYFLTHILLSLWLSEGSERTYPDAEAQTPRQYISPLLDPSKWIYQSGNAQKSVFSLRGTSKQFSNLGKFASVCLNHNRSDCQIFHEEISLIPPYQIPNVFLSISV